MTFAKVTPDELTQLLALVQEKGAKVIPTDGFNGVITDTFLWVHIKASYALATDGTLSVVANSHEDAIQKQIQDALDKLRATAA